MSIDNLNNGLLNGLAGSFGTPKVSVPPLSYDPLEDRKRRVIAFSDFWGSLGDFGSSATAVINDATTYNFEDRDKELMAGGAYLQSASVATVNLGIRRGPTAGVAYGTASLARPFILESRYHNNGDTSNATNNFTVYFGLDNQLGTFPTQSNFNGSGVWFEYNHAVNSGNWQVKTALFDASFGYVNDTVNTSFPYTEGKLRLEKDVFGYDEGLIKAFINGNLVAEFPIRSNRQIMAYISEARWIFRKTATSGATSRLVIDYMYYEMTLPKEVSGIPK
jgi:hypothetical protein